MSMKVNGQFSKTFRFLLAFSLLILFLYWSHKAVRKYMDQPISTQISYRFGDEDDGLIEFPAVSICPLRHKSLAEKFNCSMINEDDFSELWFYCFASKNDFQLEDLWNHLDNIKREDYVEMYPMEKFGMNLNVNVTLGWKTVFSMYFGTCFIFDPKQVPGYEKLNISHIGGNPKMQFELLNKNYAYKVILHSGYDFWDGQDLYPNFNTLANVSLVGNLRKKTIKRVKSTKHFCQDKAMQTCSHEHFYADVKQEFNCEFVFVRAAFLGFPQRIPLCNNTVHKRIIQAMASSFNYNDVYSKCTSKMACKQPTYSLELIKGVEVEKPMIELIFTSPIVEYNIDSISYDFQSLIGEIGGTLGLTLGLSIYSLLDLVEYLEQKLMKYI